MWLKQNISVNGQDYKVMFKDDSYQFPASAGIEIGDVIEIDSRSYRVVALSMFRDEGLIAKVEEVLDGKSKPRGARSKASGGSVSGKGNTGLDCADGAVAGDEHSTNSSEPSGG